MDLSEKTLQKQTKTYQYLEQALVLLLEKKRFEEISVRELVCKAGISRTAFYAQFGCKQDFAARVIDTVHRNATLIATDYQQMDLFTEENFVGYYTRFYCYVASKARLYRAMLGRNGLPEFRERMRAEALALWRQKYFTPEYCGRLNAEGQKNCQILLTYIISAHIGLAEYWLDTSMEAAPEAIARQLYHMTWKILQKQRPLRSI